MANDVNLPEGFVLDESPMQPEAKDALPAGFVIDDTVQQRDVTTTPVEAVASGLLKGIPFGQDIASIPLAAYGAYTRDIPFSEARPAIKQQLGEEYQAAQDEYGGRTTAAMLGTALATGIALPFDKALKAGSLGAKAIKSGLLGAGTGALYGAGEGIGSERRSGALEQGLAGGAFGAIAPIAISGVSAIARPLASRAAKVMGKFKNKGAGIRVTGQSIGDNVGSVTRTGDDLIPLSKAQRTQDPRLMSLETGAIRGGFGDEAQELALRQRAIQEQAAADVLGSVSPTQTGATSALEAADVLQESQKLYKEATRKAYKEVAELTKQNPLKFSGEFFQKTVFPNVDEFIKEGFDGRAFDLDNPALVNAKRLVGEYNNFKKTKGLKSVDFNKMENFRSKISQALGSTNERAEKAFLSGFLGRIDDSIEAIPENAIISGDERILDSFFKARSARSKQGALFERQEFVKKFLKKPDNTATDLANVIFVQANKLNQKPATAIKQVIEATDGSAKPILKAGIIGDLYENSLSAEQVEGAARKMLDFKKLEKNINTLLNNKKGVAELVLEPQEQAALVNLQDAAAKINSYKPGTINYSNTAYTMMSNLAKFSPTVKGVAERFLKSSAESGAEREMIENLSTVLSSDLERIIAQKFNAAEVLGNKALLGITGAKTGE